MKRVHCATCVCNHAWEIFTHHLVQTAVVAVGTFIAGWLLLRLVSA